MRKRNGPKDPVKALKKSARETFGLQPARISANRKKYSRKRKWRYPEDPDRS